MADTETNKRHFHRIFYQADAILSDGSIDIPCKVLDLSLKGCLLDFETPWPGHHDADYTLKLKLSDTQSIDMAVKFTHGFGSQVGFMCQHIDIDSITNLRRLVELNLGDSELLERELQALSH